MTAPVDTVRAPSGASPGRPAVSATVHAVPRCAPADAPGGILARARLRTDDVDGAYAGAVSPVEAWALFTAGLARLVDVRTPAEVHYVGRVPGAAHIEWHGRDPQQIDRFVAALRAAVAPEDVVLLLCRSGVRSHHAATVAAQHGWTQAFNVLEGFEGQRNHAGQRGFIDGWRFHELPWEQD